MNNSQSSNLSNAHYGYDFVVATTQHGINLALKQWLGSHDSPEVSRCYIDKDGQPIEVTLQEVMSNSNNTNPFDVPDGADVNGHQITNLNQARFIRGWRARLGIPDMTDISSLGDLVELTSSTDTVKFNMYCAEFQVVSYIDGGRFNKSRWMNVCQQKDKPWIFSSRVNLGNRTVDWKNDSQSVPPAVLDTLKKLDQESHESIFTVEQLLLDLETASLAADTPTINGVEKGTPEYTMLIETFMGTYFDEMRKKGKPLLSCTIKEQSQPMTQLSSLHLTDFRYSVSPYVDANGVVIQEPDNGQKKAATINYLCAVDGHELPPATPFTWNWMDTSELNDADGVIAIKRNYLADYLKPLISDHMLPNCFEAKPTWHNFDWSNPVTWQFDPPASSPTITMPEDGLVVLKLEFNSGEHIDYSWNHASYIQAQSHFTIDVKLTGSTIVLTQRFIFYAKAKRVADWGEANVIDRTLATTYDIAVNDRGGLEATIAKSEPGDTSQDIKGSLGDLTNFSYLMKKDVSDKVKVRDYGLKDVPVSFAQNFVFPAGKVFIFKRVIFSDYQDLISHITYADR